MPGPRGVDKSFDWCFSKSQTSGLKKWLRGFRAIALLGVFSKWYTTVLVDLLHKEKEPMEWRKLHVGAERGVNCEHMQALLTNILQRHWEWQEDRRTDLEPGFLQMHGHGEFGRTKRRSTWPSPQLASRHSRFDRSSPPSGGSAG